VTRAAAKTRSIALSCKSARNIAVGGSHARARPSRVATAVAPPGASLRMLSFEPGGAAAAQPPSPTGDPLGRRRLTDHFEA
jgi:hypothetical protein